MLEVVEDQQHPPLPHEFPQADRRRDALLRHAQRAGDRRRHPGRIGDPLEPHEEHPVREVLEHRVARGERQPRLAGAARAGERQGAGVPRLAERGERLEVTLAADQPVGRGRQVRTHDLQRPRRREAIGGRPIQHQVKQPPWLGEVLQAVLAQVLERRIDQLPGGGAHEHLPAVSRCREPGRVVDVRAPVVVLAHLGRAGVQPHPHAHLGVRRPVVLRERTLGRRGGLDSVRGSREGDEERVALGVDLHPAVRRPDSPQQRAVLGEQVAVGVAEAVEQAGRALDVGEEEGDRPCGQTACHAGDRTLS